MARNTEDWLFMKFLSPCMVSSKPKGHVLDIAKVEEPQASTPSASMFSFERKLVKNFV